MRLVLSTRGSDLALWQAQATREALSALVPAAAVEVLEVQSSGDRDRATELARFGRIGIFTVEVDRALLDGRARIAVHSLKDMTTTLQEGVVLAGVLPRGPVEDVLVGARLAELSAASTVGTGSLRRAAMLRAEVPGLEIAPTRGNVPTRVEAALAEGGLPTVLAKAGMQRLGLADRIGEVLDPTRFVPAVGQGIVGLCCRADDGEARAAVKALRHANTWHAARAERALLRTLHGGCNVPLGAHARVAGGELHLRARVLSPDGTRELSGERRGAPEEDEALGVELARELEERGAAELVAEGRA